VDRRGSSATGAKPERVHAARRRRRRRDLGLSFKKGDYSHWFRTAIKDEDLANLAEKLQRENGVAPENSREIICNAIAQKYTIEGVKEVLFTVLCCYVFGYFVELLN
jgi:hypothetical protein